MPKYTSRKKHNQKRERRRVRHGVPRDKRHLMHWAVKGSHDDYARFRKHINKIADRAPSYVHEGTMSALKDVDRRKMLGAISKEPFGGSWFTEGLSWTIDQIPNDPEWNWIKGLGQAVLKPFRGSDLNEQDEMYAKLVNASYGKDDDTIGDWQRVPDLDSEYMSVWDNADGHRFVGVRGTKFNVKDLEEDTEILTEGHPDDLISEDLRYVLDQTDPGTIVDVGAHSLGTSLLTQAFETDDSLQDRIRQSYLYNPAFTPFAENVTDKYEADDRVRYFIDLMDLVSVGDLGSKGPSNVVYRTDWSLNPLVAHTIEQWAGPETEPKPEPKPEPSPENQALKEQKPTGPFDGAPDTSGLPTKGLASAFGPGVLLDFGEGFDAAAFGLR